MAGKNVTDVNEQREKLGLLIDTVARAHALAVAASTISAMAAGGRGFALFRRVVLELEGVIGEANDLASEMK